MFIASQSLPSICELVGEFDLDASECKLFSLDELPIGEIGGKDGLSGAICGCRLSRVFGV